MRTGRKWSKAEAVEAAARCGLTISGGTLCPKRLLGNGAWGVVDYLTKKHGFTFDWDEYQRLSHQASGPQAV